MLVQYECVAIWAADESYALNVEFERNFAVDVRVRSKAPTITVNRATKQKKKTPTYESEFGE